MKQCFLGDSKICICGVCEQVQHSNVSPEYYETHEGADGSETMIIPKKFLKVARSKKERLTQYRQKKYR